jgi:hypothetical protein
MPINVKKPFCLEPQKPQPTTWASLIGSLFALAIAAGAIFGAMSFDAWVAMLAWNAWLAPVFHVTTLTFFQTFLLQIVIHVFRKSPTALILEATLGKFLKGKLQELQDNK